MYSMVVIVTRKNCAISALFKSMYNAHFLVVIVRLFSLVILFKKRVRMSIDGIDLSVNMK